MNKVVLLLFLASGLFAQTVEENYVMQAEALLKSANTSMDQIEEGLGIYMGVMETLYQNGQMAPSVVFELGTFYQWIMGQIVIFYRQRYYTAEQQMKRLKEMYQRRED